MLRHALRRLAPMTLVLIAAVGCGEQQGIGFEADQTPPTVTIDKTEGDTLDLEQGIVFAVRATDNLGLKTLSVTMSAGYDAQFDTTFTTAVTDLNFGFDIALPENTTAGGDILIAATVLDGNDNQASALDSVFLVNESALSVRVLDPQTGATSAADRQIPLNIRAIQETGIRRVGYIMTGVVEAADSMAFQLPDTAFFTTDFTIPANTETGEFTVVGFAVDSSGRRATSSPVTVTVEDITADSDPPVVTFTISNRVEVSDSIHVSATDPSGITEIGWEGIDLATGTTMFGDSETASGTLTQINRTFPLELTYTDFPQQLEIVAFAVDGNGNRGEAREEASASAPLRRDTVTVVNGITKPLPAGGRVVDGIYNRNQNELYLTNIERNRLEVFRIADTAYVAGIDVGPQPQGIALWPQDTLGTSADTVVVATTGRAGLSIVDVSPAGRRLARVHQVPSFLVQFVSTEEDPDLPPGNIKLKIEEYDFSDRPQHLGMVCRPATGSTACHADSIIAVYSTAPTSGQTGEYVDRGTVRWENLTAPTPSSHFLYEHAAVAPSPDFDSLQVLIDRPGGAIDTLLHVAKGIVVNREILPFQDTTFVRNSGNFTHALIGEGDVLDNARAIGYNGTADLEFSTDCTDIEGSTFCGSSQFDHGVTRTSRVRDFVANTATSVRSIAVNFNGLTNVVRADSIYLLDEQLFLGGIVPVGGENSGMDLNFEHRFNPFEGGTAGSTGGSLDPNHRMIFVARPDANIDVYDTFYFGHIATIPIRDPIIGPLRAASLPSGDQILVGVTARGVVTVQLPQIVNIFPTVDDGGPDLK